MEENKIAFACDHRGFEIRDTILDLIKQNGFEPVDCGTYSEASCDYPDFMLEAAGYVADGTCRAAIGVCYTGIGSSIVANKVKGVRAALVHNVDEARLCRQHNDANMLILGSGFLDRSQLEKIITTWLHTSFEGGRHEQRVNKIKTYEEKHSR